MEFHNVPSNSNERFIQFVVQNNIAPLRIYKSSAEFYNSDYSSYVVVDTSEDRLGQIHGLSGGALENPQVRPYFKEMFKRHMQVCLNNEIDHLVNNFIEGRK